VSHRIHSQARTTPKTRAEIRESNLSQSELMARYSVSKATIHKWQNRDDPEDRSASKLTPA
jgi:DNA-binding transcriptional regulator YiaG